MSDTRRSDTRTVYYHPGRRGTVTDPSDWKESYFNRGKIPIPVPYRWISIASHSPTLNTGKPVRAYPWHPNGYFCIGCRNVQRDQGPGERYSTTKITPLPCPEVSFTDSRQRRSGPCGCEMLSVHDLSSGATGAGSGQVVTS